MKEVRINPDSLIAKHISYNSRTNTISYSGEEIESLTSAKMVKIKITLVNSFGENPYSQMVMVFPIDVPISPDSPITEELATDEPT